MRKSVWIALTSFALGLLVAGYVFLHHPEKAIPETSLSRPAAAAAPSSALFASQPPEPKADMDFVTISEKVGPAVVKVEAERREKVSAFGGDEGDPFQDFWDRFFGQQRPRQQQEQPVTAQGTGFFISPDGYILTNNHVVEKAERVTVNTVQGKEYEAKVIGTDPKTDIALIKVEAKDTPFAELGDSSQMKVGEWVLAIGNPYGLDHTVTAGIISAKGRQIDTGSYQDFIQTDAAINRGNSGGPLINMRGEVVGITSNIFTPTGGNIGIGFAIPSNIAKKVVVQLKAKGRVVRGYLGILPVELTEGMRKQFGLKDLKGAIVSSVTPGSPADAAKLKPYDVIVAINGQPVENVSDLRFKIADIEPGKAVALKVIRDGKEIALTATAVEQPSDAQRGQAATPDKSTGLSLEALSPQLARRYGLRTAEGLLITDVQPLSEAARQGLESGMIILEVNRVKVTTVAQFNAIVKKAAPGDELILLVRIESQSRTGSESQSNDTIVPLKVR